MPGRTSSTSTSKGGCCDPRISAWSGRACLRPSHLGDAGSVPGMLNPRFVHSVGVTDRTVASEEVGASIRPSNLLVRDQAVRPQRAAVSGGSTDVATDAPDAATFAGDRAHW